MQREIRESMKDVEGLSVTRFVSDTSCNQAERWIKNWRRWIVIRWKKGSWWRREKDQLWNFEIRMFGLPLSRVLSSRDTRWECRVVIPTTWWWTTTRASTISSRSYWSATAAQARPVLCSALDRARSLSVMEVPSALTSPWRPCS